MFRGLVPVELSLMRVHVLFHETCQLLVHLLHAGRKRRDVNRQCTCEKYKQEETLISFDLKKELDVIMRLFTGCLLLIWASPK